MKPPLLIRGHLGLGDHLITNGLVRVKAAEHEHVYVPCKAHNLPSVAFMWGDLENVHAIPSEGDSGASLMTHAFAGEVLRLGMFGKDWHTDFARENWDVQMYRQAGVDFKYRWKCFFSPFSGYPPRDTSDHVFIHDDPSRGFSIKDGDIKGPIVRPEMTRTIFDWRETIRLAREIHCIDSVFAILADSIPTNASVLKIHLYARPNALPPTYRKKWEILR